MASTKARSSWKADVRHIKDTMRASGLDYDRVTAAARDQRHSSTHDYSQPDRLLPLRAVEDRTTLKKSTIYALIARGAFPPPVHITRRRVAWRARDIQSWINVRYERRH
jgi:prophage regulatory protein